MAQARRIGPTGACDVECSAVINACPHERKSDRYVYTMVDPEQLYGNETLIVVLSYDDVEVATTRTHEHGIARPWASRIDTFSLRLLNCRRDDVQILATEHAILARMRIEACYSDTRSRDAVTARRRMGKPNRAQLRILSDLSNCVDEGYMNGDQQYAQLAI